MYFTELLGTAVDELPVTELRELLETQLHELLGTAVDELPVTELHELLGTELHELLEVDMPELLGTALEDFHDICIRLNHNEYFNLQISEISKRKS